jgi:hypothetical protein
MRDGSCFPSPSAARFCRIEDGHLAIDAAWDDETELKEIEGSRERKAEYLTAESLDHGQHVLLSFAFMEQLIHELFHEIDSQSSDWFILQRDGGIN